MVEEQFKNALQEVEPLKKVTCFSETVQILSGFVCCASNSEFACVNVAVEKGCVVNFVLFWVFRQNSNLKIGSRN